MESRIDARVILVGCVGWSLVVWAVFGCLTALYYIFGDPDAKQVGITAVLVALLFIGTGAASLGGESRTEVRVGAVAGKMFPSIRSEDGIVPGGLTFFGYMLVAGLPLLMFGVSLLE